jgi:hypothetical protein
MMSGSCALIGHFVQTKGANLKAQPGREVQWRLPTRIAFRFVFAFLVLFFFPSPFELSSDWVSMISPKIVPWVASIALHEAIPQIRYRRGCNNRLVNRGPETAALRDSA